MNCPLSSHPILGPIPDELKEKRMHNMFTHLFCVLLRISIGMYIINSSEEIKTPIMIFLLTAIIVFGFKYAVHMSKSMTTWKFYPRMLISYSTAIWLMKSNKKELAGMLLIIDSIMAFQTRNTVSVVTCGLSEKTKKQI